VYELASLSCLCVLLFALSLHVCVYSRLRLIDFGNSVVDRMDSRFLWTPSEMHKHKGIKEITLWCLDCLSIVPSPQACK
jgi:hypothetical protein